MARTLVVETGNCGVSSAVPTIGRMVVRPRINPETVEVLLDTTWRTASAETARTDAVDRKAATLATFASLLTSLTATLGFRLLETTATLWAAANAVSSPRSLANARRTTRRSKSSGTGS